MGSRMVSPPIASAKVFVGSASMKSLSGKLYRSLENLWRKVTKQICPKINIGNKRSKVNRIFAVVA
jgi:hypothetical protein